MKFILTFTLPNGQMFAAGKVDGQFELVKVKGRDVENVLAWDSKEEVKKFFECLQAKMGGKDAANLHILNPRISTIESIPTLPSHLN